MNVEAGPTGMAHGGAQYHGQSQHREVATDLPGKDLPGQKSDSHGIERRAKDEEQVRKGRRHGEAPFRIQSETIREMQHATLGVSSHFIFKNLYLSCPNLAEASMKRQTPPERGGGRENFGCFSGLGGRPT